MGDNAAGRPAAHAIVPPPGNRDDDLSGARLAAPPPSQGQPAAAVHAGEGQWGEFATAPTLLLRPGEPADADDAASTSRIATSPPTAAEEPRWFRTGNTVAPPSMQAMGESMAPLPMRKPPSARVVTVVGGVVAVCLFIVAVAGVKLVYKRLHPPPAAQLPIQESSSPMVAPLDLAKTAPSAQNSPVAPEPAAPVAATTAPAHGDGPQRAAPVRPAPSPARVTTKTPRRTPVPKKTGRGTH